MDEWRGLGAGEPWVECAREKGECGADGVGCGAEEGGMQRREREMLGMVGGVHVGESEMRA
jgi:orotidine-5'-phosphate decarboxylase